MVDLEKMCEEVDRIIDVVGDDPEAVAMSQMIRDAASELAAHRAASPLPSGPSVADRLDRCRDRASAIVGHNGLTIRGITDTEEQAVARTVEDLAHAMLAAERDPSGCPSASTIVREAVALRRMLLDRASATDDEYGAASEAFWKRIDALGFP